MKKDIIRTQEYKHSIVICDFCQKDENLGEHNKCFICGKDVCYHCSDYHSADFPSDDQDDITLIEVRICPDCKKDIPESIQNYIKDVDSFNEKYSEISNIFWKLVESDRRLRHR